MAQVWFITGCSRGLGLAIAECALSSGFLLVATARKPEQLNFLVEKYGADKVFPVALDVTNNDDVIKAVKAGQEKFGRLDVVVNNAGYANTAAIEDVTIEDFRAQIDTNFYGVVSVSKAVLPILRKQGSGHIFQISSLGGRIGAPGLSAYQSAKWAVGGFSTVLAREVAPLGIKVTVIEPGGMRTDWGGSSMNIPPISEPYKQTVGYYAELVRGNSGKEPSIPTKVAEIIVKLSETTDPPLRFLVGSDACEYAGKSAEALAASDKEWQYLSVSSA
jgi:NAD(P)-dependent dehydrogenase (short-subunit alcohol dehydrogenase family)